MKSLKQLEELSKEVFESNPDADVLLATADGQFFLEENKNAAQFHAKKVGKDKPLKIYEIEKDAENVINLPKKSAEERIEAINVLETIEEVEAVLLGENAKTVKAAGAARIKALKED